jgi:hypothetical protein
VADDSGEQTSFELKKFIHDIGSALWTLEEGTPWSNKAKLYIRLIKDAIHKDMWEEGLPLAFWDYCVKQWAWINNLMAKDQFNLSGMNAHTLTHGEEGDISSLW